MAHESFEDAEIAAVMNRLFVNVKVDREQRPDVDAIYMQAVQAMTGHGGWPMTVFLDHGGRPFYGGTYFPKVDRQGMPGFVRVMEAIHEAWTERREEVDEQAEQLRAAIDRTTRIGASIGTGTGVGTVEGADDEGLSPAVLDRAVARATSQFDGRFGGFGRAPKFPQAMTHDFLLRAPTRHPSDEVLEVVTVSLDAMAAGGMYDQVGGGFHRYSVDDFWLVPHFEKMLYDQALLTGAYLRAHLTTGEPRYRRVVEDTIEYVLRDLRHPTGGFFSAEDADSEGIEGKFYLWSLEAIAEIAGDDASEVIRYFGVTDGGNFEDPHTGYRGTILHVVDRTEDRPDAVRRVIPHLLEARAQRVRPGLDDKVLLAWNVAVPAFPRGSGSGIRPRRLDARRSRERRLPPRVDAAGRRPPPALVAGRTGRDPRVRGGLRRARRGAAHARRARRRRVAPRSAPRRRRDARVVRRRRAGRRVHHRYRRRGPDRAPEGLPGQRDAVGELDGGARAAAAERAHR